MSQAFALFNQADANGQYERETLSYTEKKYGRCSATTTNKSLDLVQSYHISNSYTLQLVSNN